MGSKVNPYPYIGSSDIYVQPSREEGYGITVTEAKVLLRPIVTSNCPPFFEQIKHGETGFISSNEEELYKNIKILIENPKLRKTFSNNLMNEKYINEPEIAKLNKIIDGAQ
ncbi:glycosyltransferase [Bacillus sp. N9]